MTHLWHDIEAKEKEYINAIIEIPDGCRLKYEVDKKTGLLMVDRIIPSAVIYPGNYGFIPKTLAEDNDPLDVLVLSRIPFHPGVLVHARPLGVVSIIDNGERDDKIICVLHNDKQYHDVACISDLPRAIRLEIEEFFRTYKRLDEGEIEVQEHLKKSDAINMVNECIARYETTFAKPNGPRADTVKNSKNSSVQGA